MPPCISGHPFINAEKEKVMEKFTYLESPVGKLLLFSDGRSLTGLYTAQQIRTKFESLPAAQECSSSDLSIFADAEKQLAEYFAGERTEFTLPLNPHGSNFQRAVWDQLRLIEYGTTLSYVQLAERLGKPTASRAVGNANGKNPISIIVPCHRVIGANGALTGYAGGLECKKELLSHELKYSLPGQLVKC